MTKDELDELTKFLADPAPPLVARQFQAIYSEVLNLVRPALIPGRVLARSNGVQSPRQGRDRA